jgi:molybdopterin molybdotransferase
MDGIALSSQHTGTMHRFRIAGTQAAGAQPLILQQNTDCIEVMTGTELPTGCDGVIPVERIQVKDGYTELDGTITPGSIFIVVAATQAGSLAARENR